MDVDQRRKARDQLKKHADYSTAQGFRVSQVRRPKKIAPSWAGSMAAIERHLLAPAKRRVQVAYLAFCVGCSTPEIAEQLGMTVRAVRSLVWRMQRDNAAESKH